MKVLSCLLVGLLTISQLFAQDKSGVKFGKVSALDFNTEGYRVDSSAHAVVIADVGSTEIVANTKGGFSLLFKRMRRVHILDKNGYDAANVEIPLFADEDNEEKIENLKAYTYNLEGGKVIETKFDKDNLFKDKINKKLVIKKFTFPNIKEGSVIEFEYKIKSDFLFNLQPWEFQGKYPALWSEYNVSIPQFYHYIKLTQGYQRFFIETQEDNMANFMMRDNASSGGGEFNAKVANCRWVMKDVPALREEMFTSTLKNHIAKIEFQLSEVREPFFPKSIMGSWKEATSSLLRDESFGASLNKENGWLNEVNRELIRNAATELDKAKNIYTYVRDNITCTNYNRIYCDNQLRTVFQNKNGSEAEINLLLTAMLLKNNIKAEPVILSTRGHGLTLAMYPLMDKFNYVITRANIDGKYYYLDASRPRMGFGNLSSECYNGHARVVDELASAVELNPEQLQESKITSVEIKNSGNSLAGNMRQIPGYYESFRLRNKIKEKGMDQMVSDIKKDFVGDIEISAPVVDDIEKFEKPVSVSYNFTIKPGSQDIIYLNPMFSEGMKDNPFKSAQRFYPVEMPYPIDQSYMLKLDIPEGYVIDELPAQIRVKLNEQNDGSFEFRVNQENGAINVSSRLIIKRTFFEPDEYDYLREFFNLVVKKHAEQIVFKKKS